MTATRDRRSDPETDAEPAWDDRPIIGRFRGLPWWAAVLLAFGLTAIAAIVDMQRQDSLGRIYQGAFVVGCVAAVCLVRRRSLFGPVVQPPLVFAITAVGAVALLSQSSSKGLKSLIISVALPLTSNFPTMGITTAVVVALGLYRLWRERDPNPEVRANKPAKDRGTRGSDAGLSDQAGQSTGGRGSRERPAKDRTAAPPRRGRPDPDEAPVDDRAGRRVPPPGRGPRPSRDPGSRDAGREPGRDAGREPARDAGRDAGRDPRRRDAGVGRGERGGRVEPPPEGARGRGRGGEPPARRREPGSEGGRPRDERGAGRRGDPGREGGRGAGRDAGREGGRDAGRDGRDGTPGRPPRRRPPESYR